MPYFNVDDLEIEVDDFLDSCREREIERIIDWLLDNNHLDGVDLPPSDYNPMKYFEPSSLQEEMFIEQVRKLQKGYHMLSVEEEETIINICKKFS